MKTFSIIEPAAKEFIEIALRKYGIDPAAFLSCGHPQEDFLLVSKKHPIFVVADGVTLIQFLIEKKIYPNPSPAGDVARIFCKKLLKAAEDKYESFNESDIKEVFKAGNEAVKKYNQDCGRTRETSDFWNNDLYAATAAFLVLKDNIVYWGSICDSYIIHISDTQPLFKSPDCNAKTEIGAPKFTGDSNDQKAKIVYAWSVRRNSVNKEGKLVGYGVITGEKNAERYLNSGTFTVTSGDLIAIFTDGFEDYMNLSEFLSLLKEGPTGAEQRIKSFTAIKSNEDPDKFGHERSLIVVQV